VNFQEVVHSVQTGNADVARAIIEPLLGLPPVRSHPAHASSSSPAKDAMLP